MKGILEFDMSKEHEREAFRIAQDADEYLTVLRNLDKWLRDKVKYDDTLTELEKAAYQSARDEMSAYLNEQGVVIWE